MRTATKKKSVGLTGIFAVLLGLYHLNNGLHPGEFARAYKWNRSQLALALALAGKRRFVFSTWTLKKNSQAATDSSARRLGETGGALRFLFHQASAYVQLGASRPEQWVFLSEEAEMQYPHPASWVQARYLDTLNRFRRSLAARSVETVIVPIPTKLSLERAHLPDAPRGSWYATPPTAPEDPYSLYRMLTQSDPRNIVDVYKSFSVYRAAHPADYLYLPTDSHWTSLGIGLTALAVLDNLRARGWAMTDFSLERAGTAPYDGDHDLSGFLLLPQILARSVFHFGYEEPLYRLVPQRPVARTGRRLVLIGTSYSGQHSGTPYAFGNLLAEALGRELVASTATGDSRDVAAIENLNRSGFQLRADDLVLLEFAFRFPWKPGEFLPDLAGATAPVRSLSTSD